MNTKMTTNSSFKKSAGRTKMEGQKGLSLLEMGISATVLAALILGVTMGIQKMNFDRQMSEARKQIPLTINAAVIALSADPNTAALNNIVVGTRVMSAFNVWPAERVTNKGLNTVQVTGPFTGSREYLMTNSTAVAAPRVRARNQGLVYWLTNIPPDACMQILQTLVAHRSVAAVGVAPATITPSGSFAGTTNVGGYATNGVLTLNAASASTACSAAGNKSITALLART
jgi:Tfp pilus assembly protein PilV